MKDSLATLAIELSKLETEFQEIKDQFKERIKPYKSEYGKTLAAIRQNGEFETGETYAFADQGAGQMRVFDKFGNMVSSRRLKPEERQLNVLSAVK